MATKKGGRKNRKYGRGSRAPSMKAYKLQDRCSINKAKRIARHARWMVKKAAKLARSATK